MMDQRKLCEICGVEAVFTCSKCSNAHYCTRDHQRLDYSEHKPLCTNHKIVKDEQLGEYMASTAAIPAGTRILKEEPFLVAPLANSELICLTCYAPLPEDFYKCPDCSWPMCDYNCSYSESHLLECDFLSQDKSGIGIPAVFGETPRYDLIMTLRGVLLKKSNPNAYNCLMSMESHSEFRKHERDPFHDASIRYFTEVCKLDVDPDIIHKVRGAIQTNCLLFMSDKDTTLRGLYATMRLFNHSCIPNIHIASTKSGEMEARTAVAVDKNTSLCICYTGTMEPLWKRQKTLKEIYKFECKCKRCTDPTELGTYFSSPRCLDCRVFMVPPGDGSYNSWVCQACFYKYELIDVKQEVSEWTYRMDMSDVNTEKTAHQLHKEVYKVQDAFNELHYVPLLYTQFLLRNLKGVDYASHKLKTEIWEAHLKLFDILEPGITRRRAMTMFQLGSTMFEMTKKGIEEEQVSPYRVPTLLSEASTLLYSAISILQLEPSGSAGRDWLLQARERLRIVEEMRSHLEHENGVDI